jgi:hypothetical protein
MYLCLCIYKHRCVFVYMPDERACRLPEHILFVLPPPHTLTHALSPLLLRSLSALRSNVGHKIQRCVHRLPPSRNNWLPSSRTCLFQLSERMTCVGGAHSDEGESKLKNNENLPGKTGVSHSGVSLSSQPVCRAEPRRTVFPVVFLQQRNTQPQGNRRFFVVFPFSRCLFPSNVNLATTHSGVQPSRRSVLSSWTKRKNTRLRISRTRIPLPSTRQLRTSPMVREECAVLLSLA